MSYDELGYLKTILAFLSIMVFILIVVFSILGILFRTYIDGAINYFWDIMSYLVYRFLGEELVF